MGVNASATGADLGSWHLFNLAAALAAYPSYTVSRPDSRISQVAAMRAGGGPAQRAGCRETDASVTPVLVLYMELGGLVIGICAATNCWAIRSWPPGPGIGTVAIGHNCTTVPGALSWRTRTRGAGRGAGGRYGGSHGEVGIPKPLWFGRTGRRGTRTRVGARTSATARGIHITTASRWASGLGQLKTLPHHGYPAFTGSYHVVGDGQHEMHLLVDDRRLGSYLGGRLEVFAEQAPLCAREAAAPAAYGAKRPRRTAAALRVDVSPEDSTRSNRGVRCSEAAPHTASSCAAVGPRPRRQESSWSCRTAEPLPARRCRSKHCRVWASPRHHQRVLVLDQRLSNPYYCCALTWSTGVSKTPVAEYAPNRQPHLRCPRAHPL